MYKSLILALMCCWYCQTAKAALTKVSISYYGSTLEAGYEQDMLLNHNLFVRDEELIGYFKNLDKSPYQAFLQILLQKKQELGLNDWLFFEMTMQFVEKMPLRSPLHKTLLGWFLMTKAGFDTRITHKRGSVFVYAYSKDRIFESPMYEERGRTFINLTALLNRESGSYQSLYAPDFAPNTAGRSFSFSLAALPKLPAQPSRRDLHFTFKGKRYEFSMTTDKTIYDIMQRYPFLDEMQYFTVPLSATAQQSIFPALKKQLKNLSDTEQLEFLVAFTRSAFQYKADEQNFASKNKPMIAEEVFHYAYSDCEDRCALFFTLVKELLGLPLIVVAYPDHLTIGVQTPEMIGKPLHYKGRKYTICDPTGPKDSERLGIYPPNYEQRSYEVLGSYK